MPKNESKLPYFRKFHELIMKRGELTASDVDDFLKLIGKIFNSQDVCIMQKNKKDKDNVLKTIYTNLDTKPIKDITLQKNDIFSDIKPTSKFRSFSQTDETGYIYPQELKDKGIKTCIIGPIDVVKGTEEFLIIGTHDENIKFSDDEVKESEKLSKYLSMKFKENQLFKTLNKDDSLRSYLKEFHKLIMKPGQDELTVNDIDDFLKLIAKIFNSQDVCIMQLNKRDNMLKTIYTNLATKPIKDITLQKGNIFSVIRDTSKFRSFSQTGETDSQTGGTGYIYPQELKDKGIKTCIIGPIDVVEVTEEFLIIGTHDENIKFSHDEVELSEMLSNFLSIKFRETQLFKEGKILEKAGEEGFNLSLEYLRKLNITKDFLEAIKKDIDIYDVARRKVTDSLQLFKVITEMEEHTYIRNILSRTKDFSSIIEKMVRKNKHYSEFDDIAGVRVIVDYLSDIDKVVDFFKEHETDFEIVVDDRKIEQPGPEHYRGHHLTVAIKNLNKKINGRDAICEIQIRTSYQDSWTTKAHEETYKQELNDNVKERMALLSDLLYLADQQSEILRREIRELKLKQKNNK